MYGVVDVRRAWMYRGAGGAARLLWGEVGESKTRFCAARLS